MNLQNLTILRSLFQKVSVFTHIDSSRGDDLLPLGIDRRIGHLGKELFKIIKKRLILLGKGSDWRINTHRSNPFFAVEGHRQNTVMGILPGIAKGFLKTFSFFSFDGRDFPVGDPQITKPGQTTVQPFSVGLAEGIFPLDLLIQQDSFLSGVNQKKFSRMQSLFLYDVALLKREHPDF